MIDDRADARRAACGAWPTSRASTPSVSDAYNTEGYWDFLTVRGFVARQPLQLPPRRPADQRRDLDPARQQGAHRSAEGHERHPGRHQRAGRPGQPTSSSGPTDAPLRSVQSRAGASAAACSARVDLGQRFGADDAFGVRLNAGARAPRPAACATPTASATCSRWPATGASARDTLLEAEIETSHRSQPSVPGFSLLGDRVPGAGRPAHQPQQPAVVAAGGVRRHDRHRCAGTQTLTATGAGRRTAARSACGPTTASPFRSAAAAEGNFDRYCSDGTFDLYDFRSENETPPQRRARPHAQGQARDRRRQPRARRSACCASKLRNRFQPQAFNFVGTGNVDGTAVVPPTRRRPCRSTNRDERSTELLRCATRSRSADAIAAGSALRHTRLTREQRHTDGTTRPATTQSFTTPWLAAELQARRRAHGCYASWGQRRRVATSAPNLPSCTPTPGRRCRR